MVMLLGRGWKDRPDIARAKDGWSASRRLPNASWAMRSRVSMPFSLPRDERRGFLDICEATAKVYSPPLSVASTLLFLGALAG